jgi:hypothetical protein
MLKERIKLLAGDVPPREVSDLTDPALISRINEVAAACARNRAWFDANIDALLPGARGKVVIVAGQEAFIADTYAEARERAEARHPGDPGPYVERIPLVDLDRV